MITSALISQCRREFRDIPKSVVVSRMGNAIINLFNTGNFPIVENSYQVYISGALKTETTHYSIDLDSGDIVTVSTPGATSLVKASFKYAFWRDKNWVEAINQSIQALNSRGFYKQVTRDPNIFSFSANVQKYNIPSGAIDVYEVLQSDTGSTSGNFRRPQTNWTWQEGTASIVLGQKPTAASKGQISYLRSLRVYSATSATLDVTSAQVELIKKKAGEIFYRSMAGQIAKQGNATIDEGHFSFTNLRAMANDLDNEFDLFAKRMKPTRPAKNIQYNLASGGDA